MHRTPTVRRRIRVPMVSLLMAFPVHALAALPAAKRLTQMSSLEALTRRTGWTSMIRTTHAIRSSWLPQATPAERTYLRCVRWAESRDHYDWGWNPYGTGDGGGAYQVESITQASAARMTGTSVSDHSVVAQDDEALALVERYGSWPWSLDSQCVLAHN